MNNRAVLLVLFLFLAFVWTIYYPEPEIKKLKKEHKKQKKLEKKVKIKIKIKILRISQWILFFVFFIFVPFKKFYNNIILDIILIIFLVVVFILAFFASACTQGAVLKNSYEEDFLNWIVNYFYNRQQKKKLKEENKDKS